MSKKALFIDRDGVINIDKNYVHTIEEFEPIEENLAMIRDILMEDDYEVFIITNQAGIARGYYTEEEFLEFQAWVEDFLREQGISVIQTYHCPHHPDFTEECECRKPKPGMLLRAAGEHDINLGESVFVGDSDTDEEAAQAVGCEFVRV